MPVAQAIFVNPSDERHVLVATQYGGYFETHDGGTNWEWVCEQAVGYLSVDSWPTALTSSGTAAVVVPFEGISVAGSGCTWTIWRPKDTRAHFAALRSSPAEPSQLLALRSDNLGTTYLTEVWRGDPASGTWARLGQPLQNDVFGASLSAAPADVNRVYVTGSVLDPTAAQTVPVFETSRDGAVSFDRYTPDVQGTLRLIAVGDDADVAYVRLEGRRGADQVLAFTAAGTTHHVVFSGNGVLPAGALSPDGTELVIGGPDDGLWLAATGALASGASDAFTKLSDHPTRALAWTKEGLYADGDAVADGFTVGVSHDRGQTFTPFLELCRVAGPMSCSEQVGGACPLDGPFGWSSLRSFFPPMGCENSETDEATEVAGGCACRSANAHAPWGASWLVALLALCTVARSRACRDRATRCGWGRLARRIPQSCAAIEQSDTISER